MNTLKCGVEKEGLLEFIWYGCGGEVDKGWESDLVSPFNYSCVCLNTGSKTWRYQGLITLFSLQGSTKFFFFLM